MSLLRYIALCSKPRCVPRRVWAAGAGRGRRVQLSGGRGSAGRGVGHALGRASVLPCGPWRLDAFYCPHLDRWCPSDRLSGPGCVGVAVVPRVNSLPLRCLYLLFFSCLSTFNVIVCGVDASSLPSSDQLTAFLGLGVSGMLCWAVYFIFHFLKLF